MSDEIQLLLDVANEYGQVNVTIDEIKQIRADLIEEIIDKIMQQDYCDKSCCCDNARDCRVNCAEYHHNISAIIGMLINMRVEQTK